MGPVADLVWREQARAHDRERLADVDNIRCRATTPRGLDRLDLLSTGVARRLAVDVDVVETLEGRDLRAVVGPVARQRDHVERLLSFRCLDQGALAAPLDG